MKVSSFSARLAIPLVGLLTLLVLWGCSSPASSPTSNPPTAAPTAVPATVAAPPATAPAAGAATTAAEPTTATAETTAPAGDESVTLVAVPEKSEARYRVREQLASVSLPSDAIGRTKAVSGQIVGKMDGTIVSADSKIVVDITGLTSDQGMRDGFIQRTPLQSSQYPTVTFVPTSAPGLPLIVPESGSAAFQLVGDLTIKDVTKPTTWDATCELVVDQTEALCKATTSFTFDDFSLEQPRVGRVVSIEDTITLEIDLYLQRATP